jgi:hypothetical protein
MPEPAVQADRASGVIAGVDADYVLADLRVLRVGTVVATDSSHQLALYRVQKPVRLATVITGWYPDNWTAEHVTWTRAACTGGTLTLTLDTDSALYAGVVQHIAITGTTPTRIVALPPTATKQPVLRLTPRNGRCVVRLHVYPSRVPALSPNGNPNDTRRLGVRISAFTYRP